MAPLFEYFDYQQFLRDYIELRKKDSSWFSYRFLASKLNLDHSNLIKILLGKRHASKQNVESLVQFLKFNQREAEYFRTLVQFNKSKNDAKSRDLLEKLLSIKNITLKKLEPHQYEYYRNWYHSAIYSLLDFYEFKGDFAALATELDPAITVKQARESVVLLLKLGLIKKGEDGRYVQAEKTITSGQNWHSYAIQRFQEESINLALQSLQHQPRTVRDISTLTMTITKDDMEAIREITEQYRKSIIKVVSESGKGDTVYQLNIQLFPMSKPKWSLK